MTTIKDSILYIKNMVCPRCIQSVKNEALKAGLKISEVSLGRITLAEAFTEEQFSQFKLGIEENGFELIVNKKEQLADAIKSEIIQVVHHNKIIPKNQNLSTYLSSTFGKDYSYLSSLFSLVENTTIEKYIILQKIEKTKELLTYDDLRVSEIAQLLGYSNTQHLSSQFKKITGITPSQYKNQEEQNRKSLDGV